MINLYKSAKKALSFPSIILSLTFLTLFATPVYADEFSMTGKIAPYDFSLRDIEKGCEIYRRNYSKGLIECISDLSTIERKCNVSFHYKKDATINCRGNELSIIQERCSIKLYSKDHGKILCQ